MQSLNTKIIKNPVKKKQLPFSFPFFIKKEAVAFNPIKKYIPNKNEI